MNIYDLANQMLQDIVFNCSANRKDPVEALGKFLTTDKSDDEYLFEKYNDILNVDHNLIKIIMTLTIFSHSYLVNLYDLRRKIDVVAAQENLDYLEQLNAKHILIAFSDDFNEFVEIIGTFLEYLNNTYIYRYCCWANLLEQGKQKQLLKINPFAVLENENLELAEGFQEAELAIQLFNDLYDKTAEYIR